MRVCTVAGLTAVLGMLLSVYRFRSGRPLGRVFTVLVVLVFVLLGFMVAVTNTPVWLLLVVATVLVLALVYVRYTCRTTDRR